MHDSGYGEYFRICLGNPYIDIHNEYFELLYFPKENQLNIYLNFSDYEIYYRKEVPKFKLCIDFNNTEHIIEGLLKANKIRLVPLYDDTSY